MGAPGRGLDRGIDRPAIGVHLAVSWYMGVLVPCCCYGDRGSLAVWRRPVVSYLGTLEPSRYPAHGLNVTNGDPAPGGYLMPRPFAPASRPTRLYHSLTTTSLKISPPCPLPLSWVVVASQLLESRLPRPNPLLCPDFKRHPPNRLIDRRVSPGRDSQQGALTGPVCGFRSFLSRIPAVHRSQ